MANIKAAVDAAIRTLKEFYPHHEFIDLELEEVIPGEDGSFWLITLGYNIPNLPLTGLAAIAVQKKYERKYKVFKVDAKSLEVKSMTIRSFESGPTHSS